MAARVHPTTKGRARGRSQLAELLGEANRARASAGLTQRAIGLALGISSWQVSRLLRGETEDVGLVRLTELLATVGLDLAARAFPNGAGLRDAGQLALLERLHLRLHASPGWCVEIPVVERLAGSGDLRAWDAGIDGPGWAVRIEAETRIRDLQEVQRRVALKQRDGAVQVVILLLSDSAHNRRVVRENAASLQRQFPISARSALRALRDGRMPAGNALILL
ncbi:MAG: hypothetical protein HY263_00730 [Chloroflexi bacterium]|nr:hypothetical protein [Chloroflexota bacterium]